MFRIGCHISAAGGYLAMGKQAEALGANTFAFFTRNPRGGASKALDETSNYIIRLRSEIWQEEGWN